MRTKRRLFSWTPFLFLPKATRVYLFALCLFGKMTMRTGKDMFVWLISVFCPLGFGWADHLRHLSKLFSKGCSFSFEARGPIAMAKMLHSTWKPPWGQWGQWGQCPYYLGGPNGPLFLRGSDGALKWRLCCSGLSGAMEDTEAKFSACLPPPSPGIQVWIFAWCYFAPLLPFHGVIGCSNSKKAPCIWAFCLLFSLFLRPFPSSLYALFLGVLCFGLPQFHQFSSHPCFLVCFLEPKNRPKFVSKTTTLHFSFLLQIRNRHGKLLCEDHFYLKAVYY